ncbi:MAG: nicotinate-nucleotide--dimethylbenzimidazole phosphoribosyltransferase [Desulfobulbaceae bacterium]|nr:nicotinate-nucleotide--dimethylbenzimidazole phosphoribosyltransferase [Desulfobulbaceae bacterium]
MSLLQATIQQIRGQNQEWRQQAKNRLDQLAIPHWALGRLMDLAMDLAGQTCCMRPPIARKAIITMAGDHGVAIEGVSKFPQEVTPQMVANFVNGGAGINALARLAGADVIVVDMGVAADLSLLVQAGKVINKKIAFGTANMATGPAMTREQAVQSIEAGISIVNSFSDHYDLFGTGDMGIANTTPSSAIVATLTKQSPTAVTGRGTGLDDQQLSAKARVIEQSLRINQPDQSDGLDVLAKVGGFEIGGIAGVILGAAALRKPVVVDGFISTAGALIAHSLAPTSREFIIAAHRSMEQGHKIMQEHLGLSPLLDLDMRLGEGTGAALAMPIIEAAVRILTEVSTFAEAAVAGSDK